MCYVRNVGIFLVLDFRFLLFCSGVRPGRRVRDLKVYQGHRRGGEVVV